MIRSIQYVRIFIGCLLTLSTSGCESQRTSNSLAGTHWLSIWEDGKPSDNVTPMEFTEETVKTWLYIDELDCYIDGEIGYRVDGDTMTMGTRPNENNLVYRYTLDSDILQLQIDGHIETFRKASPDQQHEAAPCEIRRPDNSK